MGPLRSLVVEDQQMFRQLLVGMLQLHAQVEVVSSVATAAEGIAACVEHRPNLLILDLQLPDGDGLSVARSLQVINPEARVIVLSSFASTLQRPPELRGTISAIIDKGRAFQDLMAAVEELLPEQASRRRQLLCDLDSLSERERQVMFHLGDGLTSRQIAKVLMISERTVETHRRNISSKLKLSGASLLHQAILLRQQKC